MFDYLVGSLAMIEPTFAVIELEGWGVRLSISLNTYEELKTMINKDVKLFVHMVIKDDAIELIGFKETIEREAFLLLNKVSGVGPKVALSLLSFFDVSRLKACILAEDISSLTKVPGIGKKTAQRIIIELKDRIKELPIETLEHSLTNTFYEVQEVLGSLGFSANEIQKVLKELSEEERVDGVEMIVKNALKRLSR